MALLPGDQDGITGQAPAAVVIPDGAVVHKIELLAGNKTGAGASVDDSAFAPSRGGAIVVPAGAGYDDTPNKYVGDGVKAIVLAGDITSWEISWTVL